MVRSWGVLKLLLLFAGLASCTNDAESQKEAFDYVFTYPQSMSSGEKAKACLTLNGAKLPAKLTVKFAKSNCGANADEECVSSHEIAKEYECFDLNVPARNQTNQYRGERDSLEIELEVDDTKVKKQGPEDVSIFSTKDILLAESDRGRYKPEDLVRIRVLALEHDMKPNLDYQISKAILYNPQRNKVKVWENVTLASGLAQLEYQLQDSAPTGYWQFDVDNRAFIHFEVEAYVLPRFQTTLEHQNSFYVNDKTIDVKVCAKYSYGRDVKGTGIIKVKVVNYAQPENVPISKSDKLKNGCVTLNVPVKDLELNKSMYYSVDITGSVTEQGTEETQTQHGYMYMNSDPYSINFDYRNNKVKPGLPYHGFLTIKDRRINLDGKKMELCYKFRKDWNDNLTNIDCQNIEISNSDEIPYTIPPLKRLSKGQIIVEVKMPQVGDEDKTHYNPSMHLSPFYSASNNSLQITSNQQKENHCGDEVSYTITYTLNNVTDEELNFNYLLLSRFDVVKNGNIKVKPKQQQFDATKYENTFTGDNEYRETNVPMDEFKLDLKLDGEIYTASKLVVFYTTNGEVIADELQINIKRCLPNNVDIKWNKDSFEPAEHASLKISTAANSLCALTGIDKASTFQSPPDAFTVDKILGPTEYGRYPYYYSHENQCVMTKEALEEEAKKEAEKKSAEEAAAQEKTTTPLLIDVPMTRWSPGSVTDANNVFRDVNVGVLSNQKLVTKPCERHHYYNYPLESETADITAPPQPTLVADSQPQEASGFGVTEKEGAAVTAARTYFPETFLWDLLPADNGQAVFDRTLPDSITNWVTKALCLSKSEGVGLSPSIEVNVFKPFFADVIMPYSIKRNTEIMHLPVAVFNYFNHSIPIRVTLGDNEDLELVDGNEKKSASYCVEGGDSVTQIYRIKALKLGTLNVSVTAELDPNGSENCGDKNTIVKRDVVYKTVKVEAEGYPSSIVKSALLCANESMGTDHVSWDIHLPEGVVNDTVEGSVTINSDILGPVIENLDNWLRVPMGCGEQTMAGLVPNLYVLRYLKSNNALTEEIEAKALKNMETGYQRILGYSHPDGSFSAFGKSDKQGSMFLTAFVVRTLRLMKEYMHIDDEVIGKAVGWMTEHQMENGCFESVSHVFHPMGADNEKDNQTTALTSYVVVSLKETNVDVNENLFTKAKECIGRADKSDNYTMAISSYALSLMKLPELADANLKTLIEAADIEDDKLFWKKKQSGWWFTGAQDVEVAGYALLALLQSATPEHIGYAGSIVRFLQTQMNPQGGYYSTQDSVVALDGMSRFANVVNRKEPKLTIDVSTKQNGKHNVEIMERKQDDKREIPLVNYPEMIDIKVVGDGCVLGQAAVKFNVHEKPKIDALKLKVTTKSATKKEQCSLLEVTPCVSYNAKGHSNMALLEVSMPSGFVPDEASLLSLQATKKEVKKFELIDNKVVLYFDKLTSEEICTPFVIQEMVVVENKVDPKVKLYDYYSPEVSISQAFKIPICETDNTIDK